MPPFKVKAVYPYESPHEGDLLFPNGQIITVVEEEDDDWYVGEYVDDSGTKHEGIFPKNFVDKFEPERPPRPSNRKSIVPEQPVAQPAPPTPDVPQQEAAPAHDEPPEPVAPKPRLPPPVKIPDTAKSQTSPLSPTSAHGAKAQETPQDSPPAPKPVPAEPTSAGAPKKAPPPIAKKSNAFRDRLAMFNQGTTAPQPFKPSAPLSGFIKKPFQAAAPRPDAYLPPPREVPQVKTYRRDEDPEIAERQARDQENAERAGLSGQSPTAGDDADEEEQPKVLSLKERMALLQKQQQEQAERTAASHKEKPKRPPVKKRAESHGQTDQQDGTLLEKVASAEPRERGSIDNARPPPSSAGIKSPDPHANRELLSDANDADQSGAGETEDAEGTSTSVEDDERSRHTALSRAPTAPTKEPDVGDEQDFEQEEEDEEEDEVDAETRRKQELRERMARLGGGFNPMMGGMIPFGAPMGGPLPPKKKKPVPLPSEKRSTDDSDQPVVPQQRVPMFPGMLPVRSPEAENKQLSVDKEDPESHPISGSHEPEELPDIEDVTPRQLQRTPTAEQPPPIPTERRPVPPPIPSGEHAGDRAAPPVPTSSRPVPPHPPIRSPSPGSESGDEISDAPPQSATSPKLSSVMPPSKPSSYLASDELSGDSPDRRAIPPIPMGSPPFSPPGAGRLPPPPPPTGAPPSRQSTMDSIVKKLDREGETDYEGDYDTDIAPGATHKDALKSHTREISIGNSILAGDDTPIRSPVTPLAPPPLPPSVSRALPPPPPPPPQQPPTRASMDAPRAAPPLPPMPPPTRDVYDDDDYDPYKYTASPPRGAPPPAPRGAPPPPTARPRPPSMPPPPPSIPPAPPQQDIQSEDEDDLYAPPPRQSHDRPPPPPPQGPPPQHAPPPPLVDRTAPAPSQDRAAPPPPPPEPSQPPRPSMGRRSLDVNRSMQGRVSTDQSRPSASQEFIASDLDLGKASHWWTQPNMPPPSVKRRKDILFDLDESRSGNSVEKAVYVLYMDYSQTIITARFQANDVSNVQIDQRHEPPPTRLRQDQLEAAHERFGQRIAKDVETKQNTVVGNGTPQGLIEELLRPYSDALKPVGTRAFGALVYANLANASTQQYDEIRPGDIVSLRNARFQGKHGAMHAKYSVDVGKPDHVGVVVEWDGKKRKVRVWEQGRESRKVKPESFRMEDLRSGEVRVWRVMGRSWVGWS
ncbi:hypothetical protein PMIN03_006518 [Paraphaeosphaeria minitans]